MYHVAFERFKTVTLDPVKNFSIKFTIFNFTKECSRSSSIFENKNEKIIHNCCTLSLFVLSSILYLRNFERMRVLLYSDKKRQSTQWILRIFQIQWLGIFYENYDM